MLLVFPCLVSFRMYREITLLAVEQVCSIFHFLQALWCIMQNLPWQGQLQQKLEQMKDSTIESIVITIHHALHIEKR